MDAFRFDRLVLTLTRARTRRSLLGLLGALGLTGLVARDVTAQTCAANGTRCGRTGDLPCCSGRCVRKPRTTKRFCRQAPGQGTCTIEQNNCDIGSGACNGDVNCACYVTAAGRSVCGGGEGSACSISPCERDTDCDGQTGTGSRCIPCPATCGSGTLCTRPCPPA